MSETSIGQRLRKTRESKGLDFQQIQSQLRVHPSVLEKLEQNDFDSLPAGIYARGFLKKYADFLGLNTAELLDQYEALGVHKREQHLNVGNVSAKSPIYFIRTLAVWARKRSRLLIRLAAIAVILFLVMSFFKWAAGILNSPVEIVTQKREDSRPAEAQKAVAPPPAPVVGPPPTQAVITKVEKKYLNSPELKNFPKLNKGTDLKLFIAASTDAWIRLIGDDEILFEAVLKRGQSEEWSAKKRFQIKVGRPKAISLELNGYSLGQPGGGKSTDILITHKGIEEL